MKSCFYCQHTTLSRDPLNICELSIEAAAQEGDTYANSCIKFEPVLVSACHWCGAGINQPLYSWNLWEDSFKQGLIPVCSDACQRAVNASSTADRANAYAAYYY